MRRLNEQKEGQERVRSGKTVDGASADGERERGIAQGRGAGKGSRRGKHSQERERGIAQGKGAGKGSWRS